MNMTIIQFQELASKASHITGIDLDFYSTDSVESHEDDGDLHIVFCSVDACFHIGQDYSRFEFNREAAYEVADELTTEIEKFEGEGIYNDWKPMLLELERQSDRLYNVGYRIQSRINRAADAVQAIWDKQYS